MKEMIVMLESPTGFHTEATYCIGTASVSAYAKKMGHNIVCLNLGFGKKSNKTPAERVYDEVKRENPDLIAVGGLVTNWVRIKEVCDMARAAKSEIIIVIAGGFVDYSPNEAMSLVGVADYGVIGEGEVTFHELLTALEKGEPTEGIPGLIYRNKYKEHVITEKRNVFKDLNSLPFLDYLGFNLFDEIAETKSFAISTSRSCPFGCTYCTHSGGGEYRQRSLDNVFDEIDYVVKHVPDVKVLSICDELFAANKERFEAFIDRIKPYQLHWFLPMRADSIKDESIFKRAYEAGCKEMQVGLESGCDLILKSMRKGTTTNMLREFYRKASSSDISILSTLIFGDVMETLETVEQSLTFGTELQTINPKAQIYVAPIKLYPGSPLYDDAVEGKIIDDPTKHIFKHIPLVNVSRMSDMEYCFVTKRLAPTMTIYHHVRTAIGRQERIDYQRRENRGEHKNSYTFLRLNEINRENASYQLVYRCPICKKDYLVEANEITYGLDFEFEKVCQACQKEDITNIIHGAMLLDDAFFDVIKVDLKKLLAEGNVGISGIGSFFARYRNEFGQIFDELESTSEYRFILSDGGQELANQAMVIGRKIYATNSILDSVKSILVPSIYSKQINETVKKINSNIKVYSLFELPFSRK